MEKESPKAMQTQELAKVLAVLTILEPGATLCTLVARLASAGTVTDGETDTAVMKEIKSHLPELAKELESINTKKLQTIEKVMTKILTPDA